MKSLVLKIGIYDALEEQKQDYYVFDLYQSHLAVFGGAMSGKTTILKTILIRIHQLLNRDDEEIYVLDFNSGLQSYHRLPFVKAWFDASNEENVRRMFSIIGNKLSENKNILSSKNFVQSENTSIKHITFIIDGINAFFSEDKFSAYHDELKRITRDGLSKGITVIFTANDTSGGVNRILSYFNRIIAFDLPKDKYIELFSTRVDKPIIAKGRGIANTDTGVYEMQAFFPFNMDEYFSKGKDESKASMTEEEPEDPEEQAITEFIEKLKSFKLEIDFGYLESHKLQSFSGNLTKEKWGSLVDDPVATPVITSGYLTAGIDYLDFKPIRIDLQAARTIAIYGKKGGGKTNLLTLILLGLKLLDSFRLVVWDDNSGTLKKDFGNFFNDIKRTKPDTTIEEITNREDFFRYIQREYGNIIPNNMYDSAYNFNDDAYPPTEFHSVKQPNINLFAYPSEDLADDNDERTKDVNLVFSMFFTDNSNKQLIDKSDQQGKENNQSEHLSNTELQHEYKKIMIKNDNIDDVSANIDESNNSDESNISESSDAAVFDFYDDDDVVDQSENVGEEKSDDKLDDLVFDFSDANNSNSFAESEYDSDLAQLEKECESVDNGEDFHGNNDDKEFLSNEQKTINLDEQNSLDYQTDSTNLGTIKKSDEAVFISDDEDDNDEADVDKPNTLDELLDSVESSISNKSDETEFDSDSKDDVDESDDLGEENIDDESDALVFDFGDANNDNASDETKDEYDAELSKLEKECESVDNDEVFNYSRNSENRSTNEQNPVNKTFTVFLIQSRQFYQTVAGKDGNQLAERLSSFFEHDRTINTLFVFCDTQQLQRKETQEYFNAYINHAFLLNDIVRFVNDKGQRSVFGSEDIKELKERFGSFDIGDGYYFDRQTEELKKIKFIDSQSLSSNGVN